MARSKVDVVLVFFAKRMEAIDLPLSRMSLRNAKAELWNTACVMKFCGLHYHSAQIPVRPLSAMFVSFVGSGIWCLESGAYYLVSKQEVYLACGWVRNTGSLTKLAYLHNDEWTGSCQPHFDEATL